MDKYVRNERQSSVNESEGESKSLGLASAMPPQFSLSANPIAPNDNMRGFGGQEDGVVNNRPIQRQVPPAAPSACGASATGVSLGNSTGFNDGRQFGLITPIQVQGTDLGNVLDTELVSASVDHTGSFTAVPSTVSNTSGWMAASNIPPDRHLAGTNWALNIFDRNGGNGSISFLQMDLYKIPSCGINTEQDMPNSGYRIKHELTGTVGGQVTAKTTKTAEAVTINGHRSTAGLTARKEATNVIRR